MGLVDLTDAELGRIVRESPLWGVLLGVEKRKAVAGGNLDAANGAIHDNIPPKIYIHSYPDGFTAIDVDFFSSDYRLTARGREGFRGLFMQHITKIKNGVFFGPAWDWAGAIVVNGATELVLAEILNVLADPRNLARLPTTPKEIDYYFFLLRASTTR